MQYNSKKQHLAVSPTEFHDIVAGLRDLAADEGEGTTVDTISIDLASSDIGVTAEMADKWSKAMNKILEAMQDLDATIHDDMGGCF